ncbi:hypothetical protein EGI32_00520 [Ferruginibacter sp. HRS2-29]|nr:hypothetical protein [Ferruginibacter sp. HRS2-29]
MKRERDRRLKKDEGDCTDFSCFAENQNAVYKSCGLNKSRRIYKLHFRFYEVKTICAIPCIPFLKSVIPFLLHS